ncbi:ATP-binding cassette domain-containing protein [Lactococcus nasutitermitis]|uniref:ATP-binding cassette domain-containing protein n=1 Tax=Lactococcus nasutitermitis TaxID=1652957 RepID=A0ABV9JAB6_9LACT|nr:ATP-binding cassette domain-containing protein [Lactococcus nasutitermitis]
MTTTNEVLAVEAHGLVKTFGNHRAVDGVDLKIKTGRICGVLGPNGAGKTTTINMLATLSKPNGGTAKIFGYDIQKEAMKVRQLIGLTGQFASIDESLSAQENLRIFARLHGLSHAAAKQKTADLLEEFGLTDAAKKSLANFSGGMRRRLDLAASLISNPPLIFLDEPTTGLDPRTRTQMWDTIRRLVANGSTVLLTTQYLDEADQLADQIVVIDNGKVVANDTPEGLKKSVGSSSLQLTVKNADQVEQATEIIENELQATVQVQDVTRLSAPMHNTDKLTDVLIALKEANIQLTETSVKQPSLDEVFFALTGNNKGEN